MSIILKRSFQESLPKHAFSISQDLKISLLLKFPLPLDKSFKNKQRNKQKNYLAEIAYEELIILC